MGRQCWSIVRRDNFVFVCCYFLLIIFTGIYAQQSKTRKKEPESIADLFNTSSCIPKPYRCPHKQIQFFLYTRRTQKNPELLDTTKTESLFNSQFNRAYPTKIVIHGFGGGRMYAPSTDMRDAYFYRGNYNIIIVDYGTLVKEPCLKDLTVLYSGLALVDGDYIFLYINAGVNGRASDGGMYENSGLAEVTQNNTLNISEDYYLPGTNVKVPYATVADDSIKATRHLMKPWGLRLEQMAWAPRFCAKCVAQLVDYLATHPRGVRADDLHVIGYSVGSHIGGVVANYLDPVRHGKIGRITGLDPTIFLYTGSNSSRDLDPTDAHFVDVLHTGAGVLGQWGPTGHVDFYINGGSSQPGCSSTTVFNTLACDHTRVTPYFIESIVTKIGFWAYPCPSLISYMLGWCSPEDNQYVLMGEDIDHDTRGTYYVKTNPTPPFAQGPPEHLRRKAIEYLKNLGEK